MDQESFPEMKELRKKQRAARNNKNDTQAPIGRGFKLRDIFR